MGLNDDKEAVKITDCVNDHRGTLIGWVNANERMPTGSKQDGYRMVFYPHKSTSKSFVYKFTTVFGKILYNIMGEQASNITGMKVTDTVYPKSAIEGFPKGKMFNDGKSQEGVPEKRVILKHDKKKEAPFAEKYLPGSPDDSKRITELEEDLREKDQKIRALKSEKDDLDVQVGEEDDTDNRGRPSGDGMMDIVATEDEDEVY